MEAQPASSTNETLNIKVEVVQPKVMNYGSFGGAKQEPKPETPEPQAEAPRVLNYGGFGKPRAPAPAVE
jgi:hypothetical protein